MTTDYSLNYKFNTWKFQAQTWGEHVVYRNCFWHSEQFLYKTYSPHVLQKEELLTKIYLYLLDYIWKTYNLLPSFRFTSINKIANQNSSFLKMKLILHLIILAVLISFYSISALKCYNCTEERFDDFCDRTHVFHVWNQIDCTGSCVTKRMYLWSNGLDILIIDLCQMDHKY